VKRVASWKNGKERVRSYTFRNIFFLYRKYKNSHPIVVYAMPLRNGSHDEGKSSISPPKKNFEAFSKLIILLAR
jgi:hypothetical protein